MKIIITLYASVFICFACSSQSKKANFSVIIDHPNNKIIINGNDLFQYQQKLVAAWGKPEIIDSSTWKWNEVYIDVLNATYSFQLTKLQWIKNKYGDLFVKKISLNKIEAISPSESKGQLNTFLEIILMSPLSGVNNDTRIKMREVIIQIIQ